jgi:hypothetical protein
MIMQNIFYSIFIGNNNFNILQQNKIKSYHKN